MLKKSEILITGVLEDYLETIYLLQKTSPVVRVKDIAKKYNVKASSVTPAMKRLSEAGLIDYQQREYIVLTKEGEKLASRVYSKHELLFAFFNKILKVNKTTAYKDACLIEHNLSPETYKKLTLFMEKNKKL